MAEIVNVCTEELPDVLLVGKKYTKKDYDSIGAFSDQWQDFFDNDRFLALESLGSMGPPVGARREAGGKFEYWIGMLIRPGAEIFEDYECEFIPGGKYAVAWIQGGEDDAGIYGLHDECIGEMIAAGLRVDPAGWFFERYGKRFITPDERGNIVLEYMAKVITGTENPPGEKALYA